MTVEIIAGSKDIEQENLKILDVNEILTPIKGHNSVANVKNNS